MYDVVIRHATLVDGTGRDAHVCDVAVQDGRIAKIGEIDENGHREVDATGLILAPGWVDIHTHYDGQATWDPEVSPSGWHGVTTVVMGNCGVGFAPVRPDGRDFLIELMEGVEDIPGTALYEGIDWRWESFAEYLDALDSMPRTIDVVALVPHAALRAYVMGDRAHDDATPEEVETMVKLTREALQAGAIGFTSSRTILHRSKHGLIPGTTAPADELTAIADGVGEVGGRVFQLISDDQGVGDDELLSELARRSKGTVTYTLAQSPLRPDSWREALDNASKHAANGLDIRPQVAVRPTGLLFGLQSSLHPFITHPTMLKLASLTLDERVAQLRDPVVREQLLSEEPTSKNVITRALMNRFDQIFPLGDPADYEPPASHSVAAIAEREGRSGYEVVLDLMLERDGRSFMFAPLASYVDFDHEALRTMMQHPQSVVGLSDGGAHCGLICDVSFPTYLLTHWVRDRNRGPRLRLEDAVKLQSADTAHAYGLSDRGTIEVGKKADLNLIDLDALAIGAPEMIFDLPAGGRRIVQRATGYCMTMKDGLVTYENGIASGERPGRLVRAGA